MSRRCGSSFFFRVTGCPPVTVRWWTVEKNLRNLKSLRAAAILLLVVSCSGNSTASLLPAPPSQWRLVGDMKFSGLALSDYINGGAEAYHAYGFQEVAVREMQDAEGTKLTVEIYRMNRPENAFGVFSADSGGEKWSIGTDSAYGDGLLRFWKGPYFVRILAFPARPGVESDIRQLGDRIAEAITQQSRRPEILRVLPAEGVVPDSICYFHRQTSLNNIYFLADENLLNLGDDVEALTWRRNASGGGRDRTRLIFVRYPSESPAIGAQEAFAHEYLQRETSPHESPKRIIARRPDGSFSGIFLQDASLVVVLDASSSDSAAQALGQVQEKLAFSVRPKERGS